MCEFLPRATPLFRCATRNLGTVDGEKAPAQQTHLLANEQHLQKHRHHLNLQARHKFSDRRVVEGLPTSQGHEDHVLAARPLDFAGGRHATRVSQQDDFQENLRVVRQSPGSVVIEPLLKQRDVDSVLYDVMNRVFERARQDLLVQSYRKHQSLCVGVFFEPGHALPLLLG